MSLQEKIEAAVNQAAMLDGGVAVQGGGCGAAYVGTSVGLASSYWVAKADWSNKFAVHAQGKTPEEALDNLIRKLREM